jgi:hypothetical protein
MAENNMIMFKRGLQASLPSTGDFGTFYLTTDSNRLYVGKEDNSLALLNQTVQIVDAVSYLPGNANNRNGVKNINDFYYCVAENVLAVYRASGWVQINPDTNDNDNDDTKVTSASFGAGTVGDGKVEYTLTLGQTTTDIDGGTSTVPNVTAKLTLTAAELEAIIHEMASVGLGVTKGSNQATVKTAGVGADTSKSLIIAGGDNVSVDVSGTTITINAVDEDTHYDLTAAKNGDVVDVKLVNADDSADVDVVKFAADTTALEVAFDDATKKTTYSHKTFTATPTTKTDVIDESTRTFDALTNVTVNSTGHVTGKEVTTFTLPEDIYLADVTKLADWKAKLVQTQSTEYDDELVVDFSAEAEALEEELREEISKQIAKANTALTYKGTVNTYATLTGKTGVEVGDVYLSTFAQDGVSINGDTKNIKIGDMFIATSTEANEDGTIPDGKVKWEYVPSGNELNTDTQYHGDVTIGNNEVKYTLVPSVGADQPDDDPALSGDHEELIIAAGNELTLTEGADGKAVIAHKVYNQPTNKTSGSTTTIDKDTSFTAITELEYSNGHVTGYKTGTVNVKDYSLNGADNSIKLKTSDDEVVGTISVSGDSYITAGVADDALTISHKINGAAVTKDQVSAASISSKDGKFNIISGVQYDTAGHITKVNTAEISIEDFDYKLSNTTGANPSVELQTSTGNLTSVAVSGCTNIAVTGSASGINFNMVWGTF